ncbi:uncharacterized protein LOC118477765, partial [Aplysia californica]|uniref:Uncharacterized protein LOC118477765 n=1 Tax=Aplysia californica TaxID=6500 RepID=A0ABM1VU14_APLCA
MAAGNYRPSLSSNGTVLRCAFEDSNSSLSEHGLVDERELLVIRAVISEARDGVLNQGLAAITCSVIHVPDWSTISIQRVTSPSSSQDVLTVGRDGSTTWYDESMRMRAVPEFRRSDLESVVTLWLSSSRCGDQGTYTCVVEGSGVRRRSHTKLRVFAPPAHPSLSLPSLILQDSKAQLDISCDVTNLGRPRATMTLERKLPHETGFTSLTFDDVTRVENGACMTSARGIYKTLVSRDLNGTIYRCVVRPAPGSGHLFEPTWAEETLSLIPGDICESRGATLLPHPSQCRHFLQCSPGSAAMLL